MHVRTRGHTYHTHSALTAHCGGSPARAHTAVFTQYVTSQECTQGAYAHAITLITLCLRADQSVTSVIVSAYARCVHSWDVSTLQRQPC